MEKKEIYKLLDKVVGTPLCYLIGFFSNLSNGRANSWKNFNPKRILVIKLVAIGDLVVTLPLLKALRSRYPRSYIGVLIVPRVREVVEGCKYIDEIFEYDIWGKHRDWKVMKLMWFLRNKKFDLVIELDHYYRISSLLSYFSGAKRRIGFDFKGQGRRYLLTDRVPYEVDKHEVEVFLNTFRALGNKITPNKLVEIEVTEGDKKFIDNFLKLHRISLDKDIVIGIHPGTSIVAKSRRWENEKFAWLIDTLQEKFKAKVIITGGYDKEETQLVNKIVSLTKLKPVVAARCVSIKQFAELIRRCTLFISVDTGPMHIAAAMQTPVVALFGPNTPKKWAPFGSQHVVIYKKLPCSPCIKQYLGEISKCRDNKCMKKISSEEVLEVVKNQLSILTQRKKGI
jgi:predicted lipopolysaccharide heptosyltransferase III